MRAAWTAPVLCLVVLIGCEEVPRRSPFIRGPHAPDVQAGLKRPQPRPVVAASKKGVSPKVVTKGPARVPKPRPVSTSTKKAVGKLPEEKKTGKAPRIEFAEESKDLGEVEEGQLAEHKYQFKNTGNDTLVIQKVGSS